MGFIIQYLVFSLKGETKADDSPHKEAAEERQDEDNDYHRSDEQVGVLALQGASPSRRVSSA